MPYQGNIRDPNDPQYNKYADEDIRRRNAAIDPNSADTQAGFQWNPNMSQAENSSLRNEYQYGGHGAQMYIDEQGNRRIVPGTSGADQAATGQEAQAAAAANRAGPSLDYGQAQGDYAQYGQAQQYAGLSRGSQQDALGMQRSAAMGQQPSVAQQQLYAGLNRGLAQNMSMAASARGGGANLAAANRAAMNSNAQMAGATNAQAGLMRAQEMQQARDAYMGGATGVRGQDLNQQGAALQARGQSQQQTQFGGSLEMQQRGLNDQTSLNHQQMANDIRRAQLQADIERRNNQEQHWTAQQGINQHSEDRVGQNVKTGAGVIGSVIGGAMMSDEKLKKNIKPGDKAAEQAMDARKAVTYNYKDSASGKDPPAGIIAQDMEKSPAGRATVVSTPVGKGIDTNQALSLALAENANLHHRMKALEAGAKRPSESSPAAREAPRFAADDKAYSDLKSDYGSYMAGMGGGLAGGYQGLAAQPVIEGAKIAAASPQSRKDFKDDASGFARGMGGGLLGGYQGLAASAAFRSLQEDPAIRGGVNRAAQTVGSTYRMRPPKASK